jgi:glycosyltransferase involved in cell wall biosynthesis
VDVNLPTVSALVPAFDAERFLGEALDSALAQDYPAGLLDVVVVDDGSTDATPAVLAEYAARHPGRVRGIRQENRGNAGAINTAIAAAGGELLALLDADDAWPADKIGRQVAALADRPEAALLYGDMRVVDEHGATLQESWLEGSVPPQGRCAAQLLVENPATASSIVMRAAFADAVGPIPPEIPFADWWLATRAAQVASVAYLAEPRTAYRFHGANMTLGTAGAQRRRELRKAMASQRWFLRRLAPGEGTPRELAAAWASFERNAAEAMALAGTPFAEPVCVTAEDRDEAWRLTAQAADAAARGDGPMALGRYLRAAASDPFNDAARAGIQRTLLGFAAPAHGAAHAGVVPAGGGFAVLAP